MRKYIIVSAALLSILLFQTDSFSQKRVSENLFYMVNRENSFESFKEHIDQISIIAPQVFSVDTAGVIWGGVDPRVLQLAAQHGVKVMPLLVNPGFDQSVIHHILHSAIAKARAIKTLVELARTNKFYGWQFDFEDINISDKDAFTEFFRQSAAALHNAGFVLSVAVVPRSSDYAGTTAFGKFMFENWRGAYDLKALADAGDFISLMTYAQHAHLTTPGPVAGLPWMKQMIDFTLSQGVPPEKISLGIPFYSFYWFPDYSPAKGGYPVGRGLGYEDAEAMIERNNLKTVWSAEQGCSYAMWENDGIFNYLFIEDAGSLKAKMGLFLKYKFRGISVWVLGQEDPRMWNVLKDFTGAAKK